MPDIRLLRADETDAAAALHRRAGTLIPGHDVAVESVARTLAAYRAAYAAGQLWGAFDGSMLVGCLALAPGWIEHLYVEPDRHDGRRGCRPSPGPAGLGAALVGPSRVMATRWRACDCLAVIGR